MTGGVVAVLGATGRNFAAGMSGGVAYVYDAAGDFRARCNPAMVELIPLEGCAPGEAGDPRAPLQRAPGVHDAGMGDMLRFDRERLRILVERHHERTGSARARTILHDWDAALNAFVKVMPKDYRRALTEMEAERMAAGTIAAE
jgi:glutamate synthase (NADPH/NADH) large chain